MPENRVHADTLTRGEIKVVVGVPAEALAYAYLAYQSHGILEDIFPEDQVGVVDFINTFSAISTLAAFDLSKTENQLVGLGWVSREGWKGMCGFGFFRSRGSKPQGVLRKQLTAAELMLGWAFKSEGYEAIYARVPAPHQRAVMFAKLLGFEAFGPLPKYQAWRGTICDGWVLALTKERWEQRIRSSDAVLQQIQETQEGIDGRSEDTANPSDSAAG